jgi:hypothetical protein
VRKKAINLSKSLITPAGAEGKLIRRDIWIEYFSKYFPSHLLITPAEDGGRCLIPMSGKGGKKEGRRVFDLMICCFLSK